MDDYYEMEAEQRNNSRRLKQMGRKKAGKDMPFPNERRSTFSGRMIIVVLILSVTMFLKQMQLLDNSRVYHAAMSEMEKQLTVEALRKAVVEEGVYPVMNWIQEK